MPQRMGGDVLHQAGAIAGAFQRTRHEFGVHMMTALLVVARIHRPPQRREHVLPTELGRAIGVFARQRMRQPCLAEPQRQIARMQYPRALDFQLQRFHQAARQDRAPILAALAVAHRDFPAREIDVLHPQAQALHQAHPGAVQHAGQQPGPPIQLRQEAPHLVARQHHRQLAGPLRPHHVLHPVHAKPQHVAVEKEQPRQRLVLRRRRHPALHCEPRQERLHLPLSQLRGMPELVGQDEPLDPPQVRRLRAEAVMSRTQRPANVGDQRRNPLQLALIPFPARLRERLCILRTLQGIQHTTAPSSDIRPEHAPPIHRHPSVKC